jgi:spermidine dehydrogenase
MDEPITRRDFIGSTLLASGAVLANPLSPAQILSNHEDWNGYGGVGDYRNSNGNTFDVVTAGHAIRDHKFDTLPADVVETNEMYDCVVVGAGISGLAAALLFHRATENKLKCLVIDDHPIFGGEAKRNEFEVDGKRLIAHQGSAIFFAQPPYGFLARFYESIGIDTKQFKYQTWGGSDPELPVGKTPYDENPTAYGTYYGEEFGKKPGVWVVDAEAKKFAGAPITAHERAELLKVANNNTSEAKPQYEGDAISRRLDSITLEQHLIERYGITRETVRKFMADSGSGSGLGPDALSAYCDYGADLLHPMPGDSVHMFPGGNTGIARHMVKALIPEAVPGPADLASVCHAELNLGALDRGGQATNIRLDSTVVAVQHEGAPEKSQFVSIVYTKGGRIYRVKARSAVMAGGCWTTKHIVRDLPKLHQDAYAQFYRTPCLMANVAVRNWRFLYKLGMTGGRWFGGLGNYVAVRRLPTFGSIGDTLTPDSPVVLTVKHLYRSPGLAIAEQGRRGRWEMFTTSFQQYEKQIREQFTDMFAAAGFDARRDIAGIILNRWGHAYLSPQPGFFFGLNGKPAFRETLRVAPFGRIGFANSDLAGIMDHRCSILEAQRAVNQIVDQVLTS